MDQKLFKVLAVDDNSRNIQVIGSVLKEAKYIVGFAFDGIQALKLLEKSNDYDLILLDVNMPKMDGFETCREIRKNPKLNDTPVIFLTALNDTASIVKGFESGGQDYIAKPFNNQELLARVQTHIQLKFSKEQLKETNNLLEEKVKERTRELVAANTELKKVNEELLMLDETKADFLKLISHEINTPLNGIIGFTTLLKSELVDHEYYNYLEYLDISAKRLEEFTQVSLLVTKLRTRGRVVITDRIKLENLLNEIIAELERAIEENEISIVINIDHSEMVGEAKLVKVCFERLLYNTIRYSPKQGEVFVSTYNKNGFVCIEFKDSGNGFPDKILKNPFKLFSIGEEYRDEDKGISLALIKMIMTAHEGIIEVLNDKKDGGAIVRLFFPNE